MERERQCGSMMLFVFGGIFGCLWWDLINPSINFVNGMIINLVTYL